MTSTVVFPYTTVNDLAEFSMIAGSDQELVFNVYTSASQAVNLNASTLTWKLAYYGSGDAVLTKTGIYSGSPINQFSIDLVAGDTSGSSGKFIQQYTIVDFFGNTFRPSQGIINIAKGVD